MPENEHKRPHCSQTTASTHKQTQVMTSRGETAHLPPPFNTNMKSRCHIAASNVATKQQTMTKIHHLLLLLGHPGEYPPPFIPTHLAHTQHNNGLTMWDNDDAARTRTRTAEVRKKQMRRPWHKDNMTRTCKDDAMRGQQQ